LAAGCPDGFPQQQTNTAGRKGSASTRGRRFHLSGRLSPAAAAGGGVAGVTRGLCGVADALNARGVAGLEAFDDGRGAAAGWIRPRDGSAGAAGRMAP